MAFLLATILVTTPALADPADEVGPPTPSLVRLPDCGTDEARERGECRCPSGTVTCLDRAESVGVVLLKRKADRCEVDLDRCQTKSVEPVEYVGWDPWTTTGVVVGIVILVGTLAFGGGYLMARAEQAGKL